MTREAELIKMIEKLVEEKTFSLDGAKAIAELKSLAESNQRKIDEYDKRVTDYIKKNEELRAAQVELLEQIKGYKDKEKAIAEREKCASNNETRVAVAEAKSGVMYEMFQTIFRNTIVREHVQKTGVVSTPSVYPGNPPTTYTVPGESETKTTQTE